MDNETEILSRLAANYLHLSQFEPLRAVLIALRSVNSDLSRLILQTIVSRSGRFENAIFSSSGTCSSPVVLAYLSTLELLQYPDPTIGAWSFDSCQLKARAEYLFLVQELINHVVEGSCPVLEKLLELGVERLKPDVIHNETNRDISEFSLEEEECMIIRTVVLNNPDLFDALCCNIRLQAKLVCENVENGFSRMSITGNMQRVEVKDNHEKEIAVSKIYTLVLKAVQFAHLDSINACLSTNDDVGAIHHVRYLQPDYEVENDEYRKVLQNVLLRIFSDVNGYGNPWKFAQEKLLLMYEGALSSKNKRLVEMIQEIQDNVLSQEIEMSRVSSDCVILRPLVWLQRYSERHSEADIPKQPPVLNFAVRACLRDLYHYARVSRTHILECVMKMTLEAVKKKRFDDANSVLILYPRLRPLVAVMGWDLLAGNTVARRELIHSLWISYDQNSSRLDESNLYSDEISCVDHLCDTLRYNLDLATFVACVNSGQLWNSKFSLLSPENKQKILMSVAEPFVENLVLERLSVQSPIKVLFDVVPSIKFRDAVELARMQPVSSAREARNRAKDIELIHMRYGLQSFVLALGLLEKCLIEEKDSHSHSALCYLKDMKYHLEAIESSPRKIFMVNIVISLLQMDGLTISPVDYPSQGNIYELLSTCSSDHNNTRHCEGGNEIIISFIGTLLEILRNSVFSSVIDTSAINGTLSVSIKQSLEWRTTVAKHFIEDWQWRLSVVESLLPLSDRLWKWKEALTILRAAPSKLLNLCMQRAKYDIGGEAVNRFSLSAEDKATLELTEWVDGAFKRVTESQLVEDAVSRADDESSSLQDLNLSSLCSQLGSLPSILLCIDVAMASARSLTMSKQLLDQGQIMLSMIYPGGSPKSDPSYWDQILEVGIISVLRRVLKRLNELLELEEGMTLRDLLVGDSVSMDSKYFVTQVQNDRAIAILVQMIEDAYRGKRQFLSGKLHNLARAIAEEETSSDQKLSSRMDKDRFLGLGLRVAKQTHSSREKTDSGERFFGSISSKPATYLSQFILYVAAIGDIVDGTDTTHDFNYFSVIYEWPKDLLTQLVFDRGSNDAAAKAADIMQADFVHEIISACVPPIFPARSGHGSACIPVIPSYFKRCSESKALSPASKDAKPNCYSHSSASPGIPLYPLQLDIMKHLVKISPVRAVLACVFGSGILYSNTESPVPSALDDSLLQGPDGDRLFYEFALDQSERFPTLNRWIQMQTNLHRFSEFAALTDQKGVRDDARGAIKRLREQDSDSESDIDDIAIGNNSSIDLSSFHRSSSATRLDSAKSNGSEFDSSHYLTLNWENEDLCKKAVERLIVEGKLMDALALSDRFLRDGASDHLLQLIIEYEEENNLEHGQLYGEASTTFNSNSWQYCLRLTNKQLAAKLVLKYLDKWELNPALDLLTMCSCHLSSSDPLKSEVLTKRAALICFSHILHADSHFHSWQEIETECLKDPEGLALRLAGKGSVSAALEVAESYALSVDLRRELQGRQLVKLLTADPLSGGGPAEASRFLSSLCDSADALPVAIGAMQLLPDLRSKQLLVHFFLKRKDGNLSGDEVTRLNSWALGLKVLASLPLPLQQKCSSLHEYPHLILEVLLMRKQLQSAGQILKEFPQLRDSSMIVSYAAKSIAISITSPSREGRLSVSLAKTKPNARTAVTSRQSLSSSLGNLQREARKTFSWVPRSTGDKGASHTQRKRKPSENVDLEATAGASEGNAFSYTADAQDQLPSVLIAEEGMLTGDVKKDDCVRASHRYSGAPDIVLFKALLSLYFDDFAAAKSALELCVNQMKRELSSQQLFDNASMDVIGQAYHAIETFLQGLLYAKSLLKKLNGASELSLLLERSRDSDDTSSDAGSSSVGNQSADEISELLSHADIWLARAELLQSLLGSGVAASLDDIADKESSTRLCDRLISEERYSMAVYTCRKCKIDVFPVWNVWGKALIRMERYAQARIKFKQAFQIYKGDLAPVIGEIINTIEGDPPVDVSAVRSMYDHLAKSAPTILDDSLSADSYLNVLYMPSTFPRSERSRNSQEYSSNNSSRSNFDDVPCSNLDSVRYNECLYYLQEYARPQLLGFMFRHGYFVDACMLFFPTDSVPSPLPSSLPISSSTSQKLDSLATEYGTIDDLCELCVGYGAISVMEEVTLARMSSTKQQDAAYKQYTVAALTRICTYFESHKLFNYLYKFQVIKNDQVDAGLTCIQLFMNSLSQEEAVKHLERAKMHFDEGLSARYKGGESTKVLTKGARGKSASAKLTEEGLVKFSARVSIQLEVVKSSNDSDKPLWQQSLFGNPNDPETFKRRCEIAENLIEKNFDLAFQVIYEFNLPAVDIYAAVAASLADRKRGNQLTEFFRNIKGTIDDNDWDQVLGASINVYAHKHKERPDRLIDMLTSSHRKVLACVVCGRLKSAFQIASRSGSVADVQYVAHQALHANALPVLDMCKQWLSQYM